MSTSGQAAPTPRPRAESARRIGVRALRVLLAVPVLGALLLALLALRLCWGPVEITGLAHRFAPPIVAGESLAFDRVWLGWGTPADLGQAYPRHPDPAPVAPDPVGPQHATSSGPITLTLSGLALRRADGQADLRVERAETALDLPALLTGTILPEQIAVRDASVALKRSPDGAISLAGAPPPPLPPSSSPPPGPHPGPHLPPGVPPLDRLRDLSIDHLSASLDDQASHHHLAAEIESADLSPWATLATGQLRAAITVDGHTIPIRADGTRARPGLGWHIETGPMVPADFADLLPALSGVALPITPTADLIFGPGGGLPANAHLTLALGAGTLPVGSGTLPVASGQLMLEARRDGPDGLSLLLDHLTLALAPAPGDPTPAPTFTGTGALLLDHALAARRIRASLSIDSASVGFAGIGRYWPQGVAKGARTWITANITAGTATALHVDTALAGDAGWSSVQEVHRRGGFDAHDLEMWWLRPMPPLQRMRAHLTLQGTDAVLIETPAATLPVQAVGPEAQRLCGSTPQPPIAVSNGSMRITGLNAAEQIGTVRLVLTGGLGGLMCEMANPRLSLLSKHPVAFTAPSGQSRTDVTVQLPLDDKVAIDDVAVSAHSTMQAVHLGDVASGLSLDDADLTVSADTNGLSLDGVGAIAGIDSRLHYAMDFRAGPPDQLVEQATVQGTIGPSTFSALGLDPGDAVSGNGGLDLSYRAHRSGRSTLDLRLDMTGLAIALPVWTKQAGQKGSADATIVLDHARLVSVGPIHADGPGLSIEGEVSTPRTGPRRLVVRRFLIGRTRGAGEVLFPRAGEGTHAGEGRAPIRVSAHGPALDLSAIIDAAPTKPAKATRTPATRTPNASTPNATGPGWIADLRFGQVFVGPKTTLGDVSAHLENDGRALARAQVDATAPTRISLRLSPRGNTRALDGTAADTGALLHALDVTDQVSGGAMQLSATLPYPPDEAAPSNRTPDAPITGTVRIDRFVLPDAPLAARIVRDLSIYGWLLAPNTPALTVDRLVAPFSFAGGVLTLTEARAHAAALGVTMQGRVDLGRQYLDLRGTVVPAWAINQLPGRIPLIGRLLAPEKGGGVLAVTLSIKGPFASPHIGVDPLSALAPGFLRKLLFN